VAQIRAVCFDIGGVLVHVANSWDAALEAAGLPVDASCAIPLETLPAFELYQAGQLDIEAYLDEVAAFLDIDSTAAAKVHESILLRPTDGTLEIVEELNRRGYITGCLSNTNTLHWGVLTNPLLYPNVAALQVKGASQLIGFNKPAEESYLAFESMASVAAGQILFFDDNGANVEAARRFGWAAVQIDPTKDQASQIRSGLAGRAVL